MEQTLNARKQSNHTQDTRKASKQASRKTSERTFQPLKAIGKQFNRLVGYFFTDTDEELADFNAIEDVRLFDLILFCSFMVGSFAGIAYFGSLYVIGMFS